MLNLLWDHPWLTIGASAFGLGALLVVTTGTWMIAAYQSGLVVKRF